MEHDKIDKLIDGAFVKDKARIPEQAEVPDASLLDAVRSTRPVAGAGTTTAGFFATLTSKIITALLLVTGVVGLVLILSTPEDVTVPPTEQTTLPVLDTVRHSQTEPAPIPTAKDSTKLKSKRVAQDSLAAIPLEPQPDLIMPSSKPNVYESDTAKGKLNKQ